MIYRGGVRSTVHEPWSMRRTTRWTAQLLKSCSSWNLWSLYRFVQFSVIIYLANGDLASECLLRSTRLPWPLFLPHAGSWLVAWVWTWGLEGIIGSSSTYSRVCKSKPNTWIESSVCEATLSSHSCTHPDWTSDIDRSLPLVETQSENSHLTPQSWRSSWLVTLKIFYR